MFHSLFSGIIIILYTLLFLIFQCLDQVPFRLTRMLVKAMEVSGIEGNFRSTCENVMQVLRSNKDSVMAMMEVKLFSHFALSTLQPAEI